MSVLGACWKQFESKRNFIWGRKACKRKQKAGKKSSTHAYMEDLTTVGLGFLYYIVMDGETKI
jgi:hypothetical protein